MKTIKNLKYDVEDSPITGFMLSGATINIGTGNFIRHAQLSNLGIIIRRKDQIVFFPMDELVKVAEAVNDQLKPPAPVEQKPATN